MIEMTHLDLAGKRVLIRQDLNTPIEHGQIKSDARILASLPTIERALKEGAKVILMSHLGRPEEGEYSPAASLEPVANYIRDILKGTRVRFVRDWLEGIHFENDDELIIVENVRFNPGELANDDALAKKMAALCDVFVMDAFATAHRAHASTCGVAKYATVACAGPLLVNELNMLDKVLKAPARPLVTIVGGAKISTKLAVIKSLIDIADTIIVGGGIANTFIAAAGHDMGQSLYEPNLIPTAQALCRLAVERGTKIFIPSDVITSTQITVDAATQVRQLNDIKAGEMIVDVGPETRRELAYVLNRASSILWNGPMGIFEYSNFAEGTRTIATSIAHANAFTLAGGGETLAAIDQFNVADKISYICTGGGAFLKFLEGGSLPAVSALEHHANLYKTKNGQDSNDRPLQQIYGAHLC